ncbi:hypothetical protein HGRIS_001390 [Hohenbuehelia grisea]
MKESRLVQRDVRDVDGSLIPPWKDYEAFRPGTLVLVEATLHCFRMKDGSKLRKMYQVDGHRFKVLASSPENTERRSRPIVPASFAPGGSPTKRVFDSIFDGVVAKKSRKS